MHAHLRSTGCVLLCLAAASNLVSTIPACLSGLHCEAQPNSKLKSYLDPLQLPADAAGLGCAAGDQSHCQGGSAGDPPGGLATRAELQTVGPCAAHVVAHQHAAGPGWQRQSTLEAQPGSTCPQRAVLWVAPQPQDCPSCQVRACSQAI